MKTLNDSLREEFREILNEEDIKEMIVAKELDLQIIEQAFEKLLNNKYGTDESTLIEKGRADFETFIINTLRTQTH